MNNSDKQYKINATVLSLITSSPEDGAVHKNYEPETCAWCLMDLCGFKMDDVDEHQTNGDSFADLIYNIIKCETRLIYVDNLDFVVFYILNSLVTTFKFEVVDKIERNSTNQIKIFNKNNNFYSIKIRFACMPYSITLHNAAQITRQSGFKLIDDVDYTRLNNNPDNKNYTMWLAITCCLKLRPLLWSVYEHGGAGDVTITQYSKYKLTNHVEALMQCKFDQLFPQISDEQYKFFNDGYRSGLTWLNPIYKNKKINNVVSYDCNKLFSYNMYIHSFPCDAPKQVETLKNYNISFKYNRELGQLKLVNPDNKLFITKVRVTCMLRSGWVPCFDSRDLGQPGGGLDRLNTALFSFDLVLTNNDMELLFDAYYFPFINNDIRNTFRIIGPTYVFNSCKPFTSFVRDAFLETLNHERGTADYEVSKLVLECAYGSFGTKPVYSNESVVVDGNTLKQEPSSNYSFKIPYLPVAMFVTSYARSMIVRLAHLNFDNLVYIDTDSLHLINNAVPVGLEVDNIKLGAFKIESVEAEAKYLGPKSYIYRDAKTGSIVTKIAGLSKINETDFVSVDQYKPGMHSVGWKTCHTLKGCYYFKYTFTVK